jgi:hypothetical protein
MKLDKRPAAVALFVACFAAWVPAAAPAAEPPVYTDSDGVAIHGYDPVAYFDQGEPVPGLERWSATWRGVIWRFASRDHRDLFLGDPERYAPEYGGYCAYAMSLGQKARTDPHAWDVVDGRLFLNKSPRIRRSWLKDRDDRIRRADQHWAAMIEEER